MLYEPTQITPSTLTSTGTIAAADSVEIEWQVNGNSAMTAFQIDIYKNDYSSTLVYTTGIISKTTSPSSSLPFYGKDKKGNNVTFTYAPSGVTWEDLGLEDGNEYKFKITQFCKATNYCSRIFLNYDLSSEVIYYFDVDIDGTTYYIYFSYGESDNYKCGATIYYSQINSTGFIVTAQGSYYQITAGQTTDEPDGTSLGSGTYLDYGKDITVQNGYSVIKTLTEPELAIDDFQSSVETVSINYTATFTQEQEEKIKWVRWQLANADSDGSVYSDDLLDDTGEVYTPILEYSYTGLVGGNSYAIKCSVETENGVSVETGWRLFDVSLNASSSYESNFAVECVKNEDCNLLTWDSLSVIPANISGSYSIEDSTLYLAANSTVSWSEKDDEELNIETPWTIIWKGVNANLTTEQISYITNNGVGIDGTVYAAVFNPDYSLLVIVGNFDGYAALYSIDGENITFVKYLERDNGSALNGYNYSTTVYSAAFSPNGSMLVLGGVTSGASGCIRYYTVDDTEVTYSGYLTGSQYFASCRAVAFSPDGGLLVASINNSTNYQTNFYAITISDSTISIDSTPLSISKSSGYDTFIVFSPNGEWVIYGGTNNNAYIARVSGTTVSERQEVGRMFMGLSNYSDKDFDAPIHAVAFHPDGTTFVLGGEFTSSYKSDEGYLNYVAYYHIVEDDTAITGQTYYTYFDLGTISPYVDTPVYSVAFSTDGTKLIVGGASSALLFSVDIDNNNITYIEDINIVREFDGNIQSIAFIDDSYNFILGGSFSLGATECAITEPDYGEIFNIEQNGIVFSRNSFYEYSLTVNSTTYTFSVSSYSTYPEKVLLALTPTAAYLYVVLPSGVVSRSGSISLSYTQEAITQATLTGYQECDYFAIVSGDGSDIIDNLSTADFEPTWGSSDYTLELFASFENDLSGGLGATTGNGFIITRAEDGDESTLKTIAGVPSSVTQVKDFGIMSCTAYTYYLYAVASDNSFIGTAEVEATARQLQRYTLIAAEYDDDDGAYHVAKEYQFSANPTSPSISNNNSPSFSDNFTPYPTKFNTTVNYASGTLSSLIGYVDYTSNEYINDTVSLQKELYALSTSDYDFFLKDLKGNLWQVTLSSPVSQSWVLNTRQQQTTVSIPWKEIADASEATIIQLESDSSWYKDEEVLYVTFNVDIDTGELQVTYPTNYSTKGTTFSLTDGSDETEANAVLVAETPTGTVAATFTLSEVAEETDDGILKATISTSTSETETATTDTDSDDDTTDDDTTDDDTENTGTYTDMTDYVSADYSTTAYKNNGFTDDDGNEYDGYDVDYTITVTLSEEQSVDVIVTVEYAITATIVSSNGTYSYPTNTYTQTLTIAAGETTAKTTGSYSSTDDTGDLEITSLTAYAYK